MQCTSIYYGVHIDISYGVHIGIYTRARAHARTRTHTCTHTMQQKKGQLKLTNGGPKKQQKHVGSRCLAPEPTAERRHSLPGGFRKMAYLHCFLFLSICVTPNLGLAPAVRTGPTCFATSALPGLSHHQLSHHQTGPCSIAAVALPSMRAATCGTLTPPMPRLEFGLEESSPPYVASSHASHHHALQASFPPPVAS